MLLARMCLRMMNRSPAPRARAASTKSRCLVAITLPRMTRVSEVQPKMISTSEIVQMLRVGKIARNTIAPRMNGRPKKMSVIRLTIGVGEPAEPAGGGAGQRLR